MHQLQTTTACRKTQVVFLGANVLKGQWPKWTSGVTSLEAPGCCPQGFDPRLYKETEDGGSSQAWGERGPVVLVAGGTIGAHSMGPAPLPPAHPSCQAMQALRGHLSFQGSMKAPAAMPLPGAFRRSNAITELQRTRFAGRGVGIRPGIALPTRGRRGPPMHPTMLQAGSPAAPSAVRAMEQAQAPQRCPARRRHPAPPGPAGARLTPKLSGSNAETSGGGKRGAVLLSIARPRKY